MVNHGAATALQQLLERVGDRGLRVGSSTKTRLLRDVMVCVLAQDRDTGPLHGLLQNLDLS